MMMWRYCDQTLINSMHFLHFSKDTGTDDYLQNMRDNLLICGLILRFTPMYLRYPMSGLFVHL